MYLHYQQIFTLFKGNPQFTLSCGTSVQLIPLNTEYSLESLISWLALMTATIYVVCTGEAESFGWCIGRHTILVAPCQDHILFPDYYVSSTYDNIIHTLFYALLNNNIIQDTT